MRALPRAPFAPPLLLVCLGLEVRVRVLRFVLVQSLEILSNILLILLTHNCSSMKQYSVQWWYKIEAELSLPHHE